MTETEIAGTVNGSDGLALEAEIIQGFHAQEPLGVLPEQLRDFATVGELALDGSVRPIKGALSMAMSAAEQGIAKLLVPAANAREAAVVAVIARRLRKTA